MIPTPREKEDDGIVLGHLQGEVNYCLTDTPTLNNLQLGFIIPCDAWKKKKLVCTMYNICIYETQSISLLLCTKFWRFLKFELQLLFEYN